MHAVRFAAATPRLALSRFATRSAAVRTGEQSSTVPAHSNGFRLVRELVRTSPVSSFVAQIVTKLFSERSAGYTDDSLERRNSLKRLLGSHYCEPLAPVTANEQAPARQAVVQLAESVAAAVYLEGLPGDTHIAATLPRIGQSGGVPRPLRPPASGAGKRQ